MQKTENEGRPETERARRSREVISYTMSRIRGKDTKPELLFRRALWAAGLRFRKHYRAAPGAPDIAFVGERIAVFCDGTFWHGKDWEQRKPRLASNREYWIPKIERNIARDARTNAELESAGWMVLRFWETEILKDVDTCVEAVRSAIESRRSSRRRQLKQ